jgi:drug/metabolite transporter (DMT)-like permease
VSAAAAAVVLAAVAAAWGTIPLIVRTVDLPAEQLVAARLWLGALPLLALLLIRRAPAVPGFLRSRLVLLGIIRAGHWAAFFVSLKTTTVAIAILLVYLAPIAMAALAPSVLGEKLRARPVFALAMALVGIVLVARPGGGATFTGVVAGVAAGGTFAALVLLGKPVAQAVGGLRLAAYEHAVAALVMAPWLYALLSDVSWEPSVSAAVTDVWWQLLVLGVLLTGLAAVLYWSSVARLPVTTVGVITYLEPASAVVWAAVVLGETPDAATWTGVALAITAGLLVVVRPAADRTQVTARAADDFRETGA